MNIQPLFDKVLIERVAVEAKTASGIILGGDAVEKPDVGEVLAVGPGKRTPEGVLIPTTVKVGDRVIFGRYSGQSIRQDGKEILVMREEDITGIFLPEVEVPVVQPEVQQEVVA